jgi:hypothetical protein
LGATSSEAFVQTDLKIALSIFGDVISKQFLN